MLCYWSSFSVLSKICKLKWKSLWIPDTEMIASLWYWWFYLSWWICWYYTSWDHFLCTNPNKCLLSFQNVSFVSIFVSITMESYLLCISWCSRINALECLQNQECICQTHHTVATLERCGNRLDLFIRSGRKYKTASEDETVKATSTYAEIDKYPKNTEDQFKDIRSRSQKLAWSVHVTKSVCISQMIDQKTD